MNRYIVFSFLSIFLVVIFVFIGIDNLFISASDVVFISVFLIINGYLIDFLSRKQTKVVCNNCGHRNTKKHKNCVKCGSDIEDIVCPVCKGLNKYDQKYCSECQTILIGRCEII